MNTEQALAQIQNDEDWARFLPLRWAIHCFISDGPGWEFETWREYLLGDNYPSDVPDVLSDPRLLHSITAFLVAHKVNTPEDLWCLFAECWEKYPRNAR